MQPIERLDRRFRSSIRDRLGDREDVRADPEDEARTGGSAWSGGSSTPGMHESAPSICVVRTYSPK